MSISSRMGFRYYAHLGEAHNTGRIPPSRSLHEDTSEMSSTRLFKLTGEQEADHRVHPTSSVPLKTPS